MKETWRRIRSRALGRIAGRLSRSFQRAAWPVAQRRGSRLGRLYWLFSARDRKRALAHLEIAFPELPPSERRALARRCFIQLGVGLAEILHLLEADCDQLLEHTVVEGAEQLERLRQTNTPVVVLTGHCGNWELVGSSLGCMGFDMKGVAREIKYPELHALLAGYRERFGEPIQRGAPNAARQLLRALRDGGRLIMLIDQDIRADSVFVPFFGRLAHTPIGAAQIALKRRAAVVPAFAERLEDGSHRIRVHPPLDLPDDPIEATSMMTLEIERQIRRRPEQWVWMHRRWRRRPEPSDAV